MMNKTDIEYLDYTWNPTHGCSPVSEGCRNCWAKTMSKRLAGMNVKGYSKDDPFKVVCCDWKLNEPLQIKKPSIIGVSFMGDLFHTNIFGKFINEVWMRMFNNQKHTFIVLTKRPENLYKWTMLAASCKHWRDSEIWPDNIWLGVSVENQRTADERIPILLEIPAKVKFVSVEPMFSEVNIIQYLRKSHID